MHTAMMDANPETLTPSPRAMRRQAGNRGDRAEKCSGGGDYRTFSNATFEDDSSYVTAASQGPGGQRMGSRLGLGVTMNRFMGEGMQDTGSMSPASNPHRGRHGSITAGGGSSPMPPQGRDEAMNSSIGRDAMNHSLRSQLNSTGGGGGNRSLNATLNSRCVTTQSGCCAALKPVNSLSWHPATVWYAALPSQSSLCLPVDAHLAMPQRLHLEHGDRSG